ncbi:hypothetical protein PHYBLDRAFT_159866 [Phycomyces blakesleeanus NRRL 1555(-)]|uniref:EF-hand domain-containing protein n=2 Tax=Phycomyces blakesleeanus TaxID=4837 RepID=A0A163D6V2_PHYB8|nr:hypothetical protein PHYBLDRAFT_159866 [Phycomyces blakesleeanus NRRL 1555(-)]OAD69180.1 hypothetical protein PHYBLDRAFT_159866 [Phycomyces blakesleeanus NRRL 1555(-)]|eukprot:XP_018287220.1 hypothetical protein PHYBLDRAFT_159866 [Phycomyces blakesleeanus NRRL 1555(-)]
MAFKKPILCEAIQEPTILPQRKSPLVNQTELTFGTVLGLCAGFLTKKLGKLAAGLIGTGFLFLQYMASKGYVNVNWKKLDRHYRQSLDTDRDGKVTGRDISSHWDNFSKLLTHNFQFKSTFLVGFAIGFRYG